MFLFFDAGAVRGGREKHSKTIRATFRPERSLSPAAFCGCLLAVSQDSFTAAGTNLSLSRGFFCFPKFAIITTIYELTAFKTEKVRIFG